MLLSSHLLREVEAVADRLAIIAAGARAELVPGGGDLEQLFFDLTEVPA